MKKSRIKKETKIVTSEIKHEITTHKDYDEKCLEIVQDFDSQKCLDGHSGLFYNRIGMFVMRDSNNRFEVINDFMMELDDLVDILPHSAKLILSGMRIEVETTSDIPRQIINELNERYLVQGGAVPDLYSRDQNWRHTIFMQTPEYHNPDFDEFLLTYYDFLNKKYRELKKMRDKKHEKKRR